MQLVQSQSFTAQTGRTLSFRLLLKIAMTLRRTSQQNRQTRGCDLYASLSLLKSPLTFRSGCKWQQSACTWSDSTFSLESLGKGGSYTVFTHRPNAIYPGNEKKKDQFGSTEGCEQHVCYEIPYQTAYSYKPRWELCAWVSHQEDRLATKNGYLFAAQYHPRSLYWGA